MVWKTVDNSDTGTADLHGGDDTDKHSKLYNGVLDVDNVDINSPWKFRSSKMSVANPANTFSYTTVGSAILANRNETIPLLTGNDTRVYEAHTQTLTNKTMDIKTNAVKLHDVCRVWKDGSDYFARKEDGTLISSGTVAETVIQAAIDNATVVFFAPHTFTLSAGFTGFTITTRKSFVGAAPSSITEFVLPTGYTGTFLTITDEDYCFISGFKVRCSPTSRTWTGIKLLSQASAGVTYNLIERVQISDPQIGILLKHTTTSAGFVNGNAFRDITINSPIIGVKFEEITLGDEDPGHNIFDNVEIQALAGTTTDGFRDISGRSNVFINPMVWDLGSTENCMNILSDADNTTILGGQVAAGGSTGTFTDNGANTFLHGRGKCVYINGRIEFKKITAPSNPPTDHARLYVKQTDANNDDLYIKIKQAGAITEKKVTLA